MNTGESRPLRVAHAFDGGARFEIVRELGSGGTGTVYEAIDRTNGARVALKTLRSFSAERLLSLKHEFRVLADLHHPNIVTLGELFEHEQQWFFTMELVPGVDLVTYVRGGDAVLAAETEPLSMQSGEQTRRVRDAVTSAAAFDEGRLRASLAQVAAAIAALHRAGKLHLDVKPSNVRITPDGRAVLLDFGLAGEAGSAAGDGSGGPVGTPAYMAPEAAVSGVLGPAADWYAVGVVLYRCLSGCFPHEGPPMEVLRAKQYVDPERVETLAPSAPRDLAALCGEMLSRDPGGRPGDEDVLARLGVPRDAARRGTAVPFVGRSRELAALDDALASVARGSATSIVVRGESGMGKTALVQRFLDAAAARDGDLLVLSGRCHERESVPYKAFDAILDALARHLAALPAEAAAAVLPARAAAAARVFPVLLLVPSIAEANTATRAPNDAEARAEAFGAIHDLVSALARRRRIVIAVDDLQWADADGLALIDTLLRAPAPPILFVATQRPVEGASEIAARFGAGVLDLAPLLDEDARALAESLGARLGPTRPIEAARVAREASGHPLFIQEIVLAAASSDGAGGGGIRLAEAYARRLAALSPSARAIIESLAVAARPLPADLLSRANARTWESVARDLATLRAGHLVRDGRAHGSPAIDLYHDRVREAALAGTDAATVRERHRALALALEATRADDADALVGHWQGAGDAARAGAYALTAAERAEGALAFDRAATLYRLALASLDLDAARRLAITIRVAHSLSSCGRSADAASVYVEAAAIAAPDERLDLQRRAAEECLVCGHVDRGLDLLDGVLAAHGMRMPQTQLGAFARFGALRARVMLRGLEFVERPEKDVPRDLLRRVDLCWSAWRGLALHDIPRSAAFASQHLLLALEAGEPRRVGLALMLEGALLATIGEGGRRRSRELHDMVAAMAERLDDPYLRAWIEGTMSIEAVHAGKWEEACERATRTWAHLDFRPEGVIWEFEATHRISVMAKYFLGDLVEMDRVREPQVRRALDRGDRLMGGILQTDVCCASYLARDDAAEAREHAREALDGWSTRGFHFQHYQSGYAEAQAALYAGDASDARSIVLRMWKPTERSRLTLLPFYGISSLDLRARVSLACGDTRDARAAARKLEKRREPWAHALAALVHAGAVRAERGARAAVEPYRAAIRALDDARMGLYAAVARVRLGECLPGTEAHALSEAGHAFLASQRIVRPDRFVAMLAP